MKKILAFILCAFMIGAFALVASAEGEVSAPIESVTEEAIAPETEGIISESEISGTEEEPADTTPEAEPGEAEFELSAQAVADYIKMHLEEISVIITMILSVFYNARKHGFLNKSITTLNNNSVTVAENSAASIKESLVNMQSVANIVMGYKEEIAKMLDEVRRNDEDRAKLESSLSEVSDYLKATRMANVELANEVAELLVLANIPNSKKDELYSRHLKAVNAIAEAEKAVEIATGVKNNEEGNEA